MGGRISEHTALKK